jgi:hypothetical protein
MTEAEMVNDCYKKLKLHKNYKEIILEVPYLSRCIDMVLVDNKDSIISIEFKLKNWRKAVQQAKDHKLGSDKAYICLPKPKKISDQLVDSCRDNGIGIFFYNENNDDPLEEFISPIVDEYKWQPRVLSLKRLINRISGNNVFYI